MTDPNLLNEVARIIDPHVWSIQPSGPDPVAAHLRLRGPSLSKASQVLVLVERSAAQSQPCAEAGTHIPPSPEDQALPGFSVIRPILPDWNNLTNEQRSAICERADYWDCEECSPISRDAAHGMYLIIQTALGDAPTRPAEQSVLPRDTDKSSPTKPTGDTA